MKGKIIAFFVMTLLIVSIFGNILTTKAKVIGTFKEKTSENKLINYLDGEQQPIRPQYEDEIKVQEPTCVKGSDFVYEPPWDSHYWVKEKEIYGICDAWQEESDANSQYAQTRIQTWAGGAGYALIRVWLCQGFYFYPPKTTKYTIQITHSTEGFISGSTWGLQAGSACNSVVYFFFVAGFDNFKKSTIRDEWSLFGGPGYSENFDETETQTIQLKLEKGERYWIGSQTLMKGWSEGFGLSYSSTDSKTIGDDSRLKKIIITYDNDPPTKPTIDGPTSGSEGTHYIYYFKSTDPEERAVSFYIEWGDGTNYGWTTPTDSGRQISMSHSWPTSGTYTLRAKAKDQDGIESDWATMSVTMPKGKIKQNLNHLLQTRYTLLRHLLQKFV
jgi:hypothetical protein